MSNCSADLKNKCVRLAEVAGDFSGFVKAMADEIGDIDMRKALLIKAEDFGCDFKAGITDILESQRVGSNDGVA